MACVVANAVLTTSKLLSVPDRGKITSVAHTNQYVVHNYYHLVSIYIYISHKSGILSSVLIVYSLLCYVPVLCSMYCLLTISDVVIIDFDEEVSVRSTLLVPSTQCVEYLMHHNPLVLTAPPN